jgi:hypothetical protein
MDSAELSAELPQYRRQERCEPIGIKRERLLKKALSALI